LSSGHERRDNDAVASRATTPLAGYGAGWPPANFKTAALNPVELCHVGLCDLREKHSEKAVSEEKVTLRESCLEAERRQQVIREVQVKIGREQAAVSEVPKTMPQRIADLLRELDRRLREP
jgi:hypothetical protein